MKPNAAAFALLFLTGIPMCSYPPQTRKSSQPGSQSTTTPVRNYDECVKAGYPTGKAAGQERCWTPTSFRIFVKGLKPTIHQGLYGSITLRSGNCMPGMIFGDERDKIPPPNPCTLMTVDRTVYIMEPIEARYKWHGPYLSADLPPFKITKSINSIYEIELPVGRYELCVEDNGKKYCRWVPFTIEKERLQEFNIEINHAVY